MSYLVLARKYRPQRFEELVGQEHVARTLTNAIGLGRVHHAFLFTGARGVGKTSAARILAKALCCVQGPTATPCGSCDSCKEIASGQSVDVLEIDGASNTSVDDVRTLRESARYAPAKGRRKVYIIDEVHMLSTSAFNALLKTLEEPPPHVVFIFATTEVHKIPTTILSRCQRYDFKLIPTTQLTAHLADVLRRESIRFEDDGLRLVARQAAGSVRDGLSLLDQIIAFAGDEAITRERVVEVLGVADRRLLVALLQAALARDAGRALRLLADAIDRGVDLGQLARAFLGHLHDVEIAALVAEPGPLLDLTADELTEAKEIGSGAPRGLLGALFDRWARAVDEAARSQTPRLLLEMALVDLCFADPLLPLGDLLKRLEELEGRLADGGPGPPGPGPSSPRPGGPGVGGGAGRRPPGLASAPPGTGPGPRERSEGPAWGAPEGAAPLPGAALAPGPPARAPISVAAGPTTAAPTSAAAGTTSVAASPPSTGGAPTSAALVSGSAPVFAPPARERASSPPLLERTVPSAPPAGNGASRGPALVPAGGSAFSATPVGQGPGLEERWRAVRLRFEERPSVAAALDHAEVAGWEPGRVTLLFAERFTLDLVEKHRSDLERVLAEVSGTPTRAVLQQGVARPTEAPVIRSEVWREADAAAAERRRREKEAREHPIIRKAQEVFGVSIREVKTA